MHRSALVNGRISCVLELPVFCKSLSSFTPASFGSIALLARVWEVSGAKMKFLRYVSEFEAATRWTHYEWNGPVLLSIALPNGGLSDALARVSSPLFLP